jgi:hypothetical protein
MYDCILFVNVIRVFFIYMIVYLILWLSQYIFLIHVGWLAGSLDTYLNDQFSKDKINQCLNIRQKIVDIINFTEKPELISIHLPVPVI